MESPWKTMREQHKHQLRSTIAAAARDLALEQGLAAITMGAIAARVNVSRATVYNYFPDVEQALLWAVEEEVAKFTAAIEQQLTGDPAEQLRAYVHAQVHFFDQPDRRVAALHFQLAGLSPLVRERMHEHTAGLRAMLVRIVTAGRRSGDFRTDLDPDRCAELVIYLLAGIREQVLRGDTPAGTLVDETVAFIEHGLRGVPERPGA